MGTNVPINAAITVPLSVVCSVGNVTAINSVVASAQTPQQAARLFAKIVSPAIGQAVANAVQQMLVQSESQSSVNPPTATSQIQGWRLTLKAARANMAKKEKPYPQDEFFIVPG
jgi:hypothetical protein